MHEVVDYDVTTNTELLQTDSTLSFLLLLAL